MAIAHLRSSSTPPAKTTRATVQRKSRAKTEKAGDICVVETLDGDRYLGVPVIRRKTVTVYTGQQGRPVVLSKTDVDYIVPAAYHPDVVIR